MTHALWSAIGAACLPAMLIGLFAAVRCDVYDRPRLALAFAAGVIASMFVCVLAFKLGAGAQL